MSSSFNRVGLGILLVGLLGACGSSGGGAPAPASAPLPTPDDVAASWPSMKATIGATGGTLAGAAGTVFEGLSLVVPAGALAAGTEITVTQSEDPTPLPVGARRIGPQFTIAAGGAATLGAPASLTLPALREEVESYGSQTGDMKVWGLASGAWVRSEPTATAEGRVTIDLPAFTTVAAGIKFSPIPPVCGASCVAAIACADGIGFCVTPFGTLSPTPEDSLRSFAVSGSTLYWMTAGATGSRAVRRPFGASGFTAAAELSAPAAGLAFARYNPAVRASDGTYWVGTGTTGNVVFGFGGLSTRVFTHPLGSATPFIGYGGVAAGSTFAMLTSVNGTEFDPPRGEFSFLGFNPAIPATVVTYKPLPSPSSASTYVYWVSTDASDNLADSTIRTFDLDETTGKVAGGIGPFISTTSRVLFVDLAPDGTVAALTRDVNVPDYVAIWKNNKLVEKVTLPSPLSVGRFAFDSLGGLWIGANNAPQIFHRAANGDLASTTLSNAAAGTADALNAVPHRILATNEPGRVVVITLGDQVYRASYGVR